MRPGLLVAAALLSAVPATGDSIDPTPVQVDTLTQIDALPTRAVVDRVFAPGPGPTPGLDALLALAGDTSRDVGLQIRAIRALPQYCLPACAGTRVHDALFRIVDGYRTQLAATALAPQDMMRLRTAMEALGATQSGLQGDVDLLTDPTLLHHASRDVQVTAVTALRSLCSPDLCTPDACLQDVSAVRSLRTGADTQVDAAINSALADLARCVQP
ncbi:MAG TPA: hypothetical protein VHW23_00440 [Kofleriaceae bacterium]|jgi:hypothetical protein|nr:hypothetical protein [Kofleriaceae bacterium]